MKKLVIVISGLVGFFSYPLPVFAAVDAGVTTYTNNTLSTITVIASAAVTLFLVRGGYLYITSNGNPDELMHAKRTIRNALIGLTLILASTMLVSFMESALTPAPVPSQTTNLTLTPITTSQNNGVVQVFIATIIGFMQAIVQSATKPIVDAVFLFLTQTPSVLTNPVIHHFWLIMVGITDALYIVVVAFLGLHLMSASTFGFDEVELKKVLPRIGLSFLGANTSLFLIDYVIRTNNMLVAAVIQSTGGLSHAWVLDAITIPNLITGSAKLVTLLFFVLFLVIAIVLLLLYVSRLILISLAAVISPFIFLLFALPKFTDFAEIASKMFVVTVFIEFVHVVIIQLAFSFLALSNTNNSLLAIVMAIGLFATLLKMPSVMMHMVFYTAKSSAMKKMGGQVLNVITVNKKGNLQQQENATHARSGKGSAR